MDQAGTAQPCFVGARYVNCGRACWDVALRVVVRSPVPFRGSWCDVSNFRFDLIAIQSIEHRNPVQLVAHRLFISRV